MRTNTRLFKWYIFYNEVMVLFQGKLECQFPGKRESLGQCMWSHMKLNPTFPIDWTISGLLNKGPSSVLITSDCHKTRPGPTRFFLSRIWTEKWQESGVFSSRRQILREINQRDHNAWTRWSYESPETRKSRQYKRQRLSKSVCRKRRTCHEEEMSHENDGTSESWSMLCWVQHSWNLPGFQMTLQFHSQSLCGPNSAGVLDLPKANWIAFPEFPYTRNFMTNLWIIWMNLCFCTQTNLIKSTCLLYLTYVLAFLGSV